MVAMISLKYVVYHVQQLLKNLKKWSDYNTHISLPALICIRRTTSFRTHSYLQLNQVQAKPLYRLLPYYLPAFCSDFSFI